MRVLVLSSTFPQFAGDHRGAFLLRHWEGQAARGARVRVIAPRTAWSRPELPSPCELRRFAYAPRALSSLTGRFGILENLREAPWRSALVAPFALALAGAVERELRAFRPQLFAAHMLLPCGLVAAPLALRRAVPFELYGHGTDVDLLLRLPGPLRRRALALCLRARRVHLPSQEKLERLRAALGPRAREARLRVETMAHCVEPAAPCRGGRDLLYLGRLIPQKGVDVLLEAVARLPGRPRLHVGGDGPERARLEGLARALGVDARFHGFVTGAPKEDLWRRAALLCVPSRELPSGLSEGAPLVVVEALRRELPVVAARVGGIPELCRDAPDARLVPPGDPGALAAALGAALAARATPQPLASQAAASQPVAPQPVTPPPVALGA